MASRWLAMICACQTKAMDMKLMEITQKIRTRPMLDSRAGRRKTRRSQAMVRALLVLGSNFNSEFARIRAGSAGAWRLPNILSAIEGPRADEWPNLLTYGKWMVCETCDSEPSWDPSWRCPSRLAFEQHFSPGIYFFVGM